MAAGGLAARTRHDHAQELAQDYVELISDLLEYYGEARVVDLARRLGVTHVTVNRTIHRLRRAGFVSSEPYRPIFLTAAGQRLARESRERHEVVVRFLVQLRPRRTTRAIGSPNGPASW